MNELMNKIKQIEKLVDELKGRNADLGYGIGDFGEYNKDALAMVDCLANLSLAVNNFLSLKKPSLDSIKHLDEKINLMTSSVEKFYTLRSGYHYKMYPEPRHKIESSFFQEIKNFEKIISEAKIIIDESEVEDRNCFLNGKNKKALLQMLFRKGYYSDQSSPNYLLFDLESVDLRNVNLSNFTLESAILNRANLTKAKLRKTNLSKAKLRNALLTGADLTKASLEEADLVLADLSAANLTEANLPNADLRGANLEKADLTAVNFIGADLRKANLRFSNLTKADFTGADLTKADLLGASINKSNFSYQQLKSAKGISPKLLDKLKKEGSGFLSQVEEGQLSLVSENGTLSLVKK